MAAVLLIHRAGSGKLHLECNKEFLKAVVSATVSSAALPTYEVLFLYQFKHCCAGNNTTFQVNWTPGPCIVRTALGPYFGPSSDSFEVPYICSLPVSLLGIQRSRGIAGTVKNILAQLDSKYFVI